MKDLIQWLRKVEHVAGEVYSYAASVYADDPNLSKFLLHTAEDEAWHYHVMGSAADFLLSDPSVDTAITIDNNTGKKIFGYFNDIKEGIEKRTLSRNELIKKIVEVELSEWNDIFLYVVNTLKERSIEFKYPAARMQAHLKSIAHYVENVENKLGMLDEIKKLPPVWTEMILVVDDSPIIVELVKNLLNRDGNIDSADNGKTALELIEKKFYKLIISDVDMPVMDGLALFEGAMAKFPAITSRFLFMTGDLSNERISYFNEHQVKYLTKPFSINVLVKETNKILLSK